MTGDRSLLAARRLAAAGRCRADDALMACCRRQFGVFSLGQSAECGVPEMTVLRRHARGQYVRLWPGVFRVAGAPDSREGRWMASLLLHGGDAALARSTAADALGLDHGLRDAEGHLLVRHRRFVPRPGVVVHRSRAVTEADIVRIGPLRVTSATWTLTDLAGLVDQERLRKLVSAAVREGQTSAEHLRHLIDRRRRFSGRTALRRIVAELSPLEVDNRSELESLFLRVTERAGIPPSAMNHPVVDAAGERRLLDAAYVPERLPIELDSRAYHGTLLDWNDDLRRENGIKLAGWRDPLRFSYADLRDRPGEVVEVIRTALVEVRAQGPAGKIREQGPAAAVRAQEPTGAAGEEGPRGGATQPGASLG